MRSHKRTGLTILRLKALIFVFPAIARIASTLFFKFNDLHGKKLEKMRQELEKHHELKPK